MDICLKIILGLVTLICLLGGANLLIKGAYAFLPDKSTPHRVLDNLFRFLSGIYFGLGFLMSWVLLHAEEVGDLVYLVGLVVVFSGLGRLYSRLKVGSAGMYFNSMMIVELVLGVLIIVFQYLKP